METEHRPTEVGKVDCAYYLEIRYRLKYSLFGEVRKALSNANLVGLINSEENPLSKKEFKQIARGKNKNA